MYGVLLEGVTIGVELLFCRCCDELIKLFRSRGELYLFGVHDLESDIVGVLDLKKNVFVKKLP